MLFSRDDVAGFINDRFEPVWEMVREVPKVRIDFGGGRVVTRTLHGNIATCALTADGEVLDVLPGIYDPASYLDGLNRLLLLAQYAGEAGEEGRAARLRAYHRAQAKALRAGAAPLRLAMAPVAKSAIERPVRFLLLPGDPVAAAGAGEEDAAEALPSAPIPAGDLSSWKALVEDARINETARRLKIHEMLAEKGPVASKDFTRPLYREVLHADLDDPYLGLGELLFASYPFDDSGPGPGPIRSNP